MTMVVLNGIWAGLGDKMLGERRPEGADENEYQCFETMA
jgi:hypothetical protein